MHGAWPVGGVAFNRVVVVDMHGACACPPCGRGRLRRPARSRAVYGCWPLSGYTQSPPPCGGGVVGVGLLFGVVLVYVLLLVYVVKLFSQFLALTTLALIGVGVVGDVLKYAPHNIIK